jgi:hypothetical protein
MSFCKRFLVIFFSLFFLGSAQAQDSGVVLGKTCLLTRSLQVTDLIDNSGKVFVGKFLGSKNYRAKGLDVRELEFALDEPLKGIKSKNKTITIKEWGRSKSPFVDNQVEKNIPYVFFFYEESAKGLSSLVGHEQGFAELSDSGELKFSKRLNLKSHKKQKFSLMSNSAKPLSPEIHTLKDLKQALKAN